MTFALKAMKKHTLKIPDALCRTVLLTSGCQSGNRATALRVDRHTRVRSGVPQWLLHPLSETLCSVHEPPDLTDRLLKSAITAVAHQPPRDSGTNQKKTQTYFTLSNYYI